ncbi:MAG: hypothetical protein HY747_07590, partial [Elusimicrobia bacterium]|nr:hypothetical protein [Elusimicrobiota bacterium]
PATVKVSRRFLMDLNYFRGKNVWENSKTKLHINDGRVFVRRTQAQYDLIVANLPDTRREGASVFYSLEFMKLVRSRLSPEGIFITHLWRSAGPGYGRQEEAAAMLIITATAKAVFGGNTYLLSPRLWPKKVKPYDWGAPPLLMASNGPLDLDNAAIEKRFQNLEPKPAWMTPERCLRWLENSYLPPGLDGFPISTDDRPAILYASLWKRRPAVSAILRLDD